MDHGGWVNVTNLLPFLTVAAARPQLSPSFISCSSQIKEGARYVGTVAQQRSLEDFPLPVSVSVSVVA